jgi:hypothetical protein
MKPRNLYRIVIGALFLVAGFASAFLSSGDTIVSTIFLAAGAAFLVTGIAHHRRYGNSPDADERSRKIGAYGLSYAWLTGLIGICLLFWLDYLGIFRVSTQAGYGISVLILALSAVIFQAYLFRKGDVA